MKKLIVTCELLIFSMGLSRAQSIFPLYADTPSWNVLECFFYNCSTDTYGYVYDTLFCGQTYSTVPLAYNLQFYVRNENQKTVYRKSTNCMDKEYILYDYSLNIGDSVYVGYNQILGTFPIHREKL